MWTIRNARLEDVPNLAVVETLCFSKDEAASEETFKKRVETIPDTFFVAEEAGQIIGFINGPVIDQGYITDDLFSEVRDNKPASGHQSILGLAVAPIAQKRGVASDLLNHIEKEAMVKRRDSLTLTCKEELIPFYEQFGFENKGVSLSEHGGSVWYNMVKELN